MFNCYMETTGAHQNTERIDLHFVFCLTSYLLLRALDTMRPFLHVHIDAQPVATTDIVTGVTCNITHQTQFNFDLLSNRTTEMRAKRGAERTLAAECTNVVTMRGSDESLSGSNDCSLLVASQGL